MMWHTPLGPHDVYSCFDSDGVLLYVGMTSDLATRLTNHKYATSWWGQVARVTHTTVPDRPTARELERDLIRSQAPLFNVRHAARRAAA